MRIRLSQLKRLIREAVEEAMEEQELDELEEMDELDEAELDQWGSNYSSGGVGGNRHGDSVEDTSGDREYQEYKDRNDRERWAKEREEGMSGPGKKDDDYNPYT